ncbi:hypothetical protein K504DRAFT_183518 [Pleomassaria siparia CBS 279.74]|uniref:Uncharacterized protein n=1 Tax=Pleomassaria siparia CBS 279.74 TaxID=1314801 RepID=A0A6G1JSA5_9PLEO|nr:hypothetical protein K504DRAFT_183518 [Pleomassaria siparia CBS 279.74]
MQQNTPWFWPRMVPIRGRPEFPRHPFHITNHDASFLLVDVLSHECFSNDMIESIESIHTASAWSGVFNHYF